MKGETEDELRAALYAFETHPTITKAAEAIGLSRSAFRERVGRARVAFGAGPLLLPPTHGFSIEDLPSATLDAPALIARRAQQFAAKATAVEARRLVTVRVKTKGPYGLALLGDPHLDDDGTDIKLLERHCTIVNATPGIYAGNVGDYHNNWIGRLARLYGQQSTSAAEALVLVEWFIREVPWMFLVAGNHDCWSGDGDPIKWMARQARVTYEAHGMRLALTSPNGRAIRLNARHDFSGRSQWNTAHGPAKAAQMGWRDHVLACGHTHTSGYQILRDPSSGLISHALRVGSYKTFDRYAEEKGLPNQTISPCVLLVVQPARADDDPGLVTVFHDLETGAEFLTWLRRKK